MAKYKGSLTEFLIFLVGLTLFIGSWFELNFFWEGFAGLVLIFFALVLWARRNG
ncbi:MAG: hypothetical protein ISS25_03430 [Nanoarchaeota archaeon]|nr:hypothetical protein [DPANN group archaeon]MBL7116853.1 hypothetical protein [Nanoarchaeota archaeon]